MLKNQIWTNPQITLVTGICLCRDRAGEPGRELIYRGLWGVDEGGSTDGGYVWGSPVRGT